MAKKVTMDDIAASLNVSKSLVSRALANKYGVNDDTRFKILLEATRQGYAFNNSKIKTTRNIDSVTVIMLYALMADNSYMATVLEGIEEALSRKNISCKLKFLEMDENNVDYPVMYWRLDTSGVIVLGYITDANLLSLSATGYPIVLAEVQNETMLNFDKVMVNNYYGGYTATQHLLSQGFKRFMYIGASDVGLGFSERFRGFRDCLERQNDPEISYMKWDDNCSLLDYGSSYLPKNKQSHLYIEYNRGLQKVLQRIRAKYPELVMQLCAGGGARVNYGLLPYFDEFWTSDDTDALQRIYMQWGVSGFFPAIAMASHVSADKNHQTGRRIPLKFRFDVAMSGRLGMEIQPKDMNDVDKAFAKRAIAAYKDIRPVVQFGDLYRLVSPYDNKGVSSLMYVTSEKNKAVFYAYKISHFINMVIPKVCMNGLDPSKNYRLVDLTPVDSSKPCDLNGKIISGKILMEEGIALKSLLKSEYSSLALQLQAVD